MSQITSSPTNKEFKNIFYHCLYILLEAVLIVNTSQGLEKTGGENCLFVKVIF